MTGPDPQVRADYIAGLRRLADLLEATPEMPLLYHGVSAPITVYAYGRDEIRAAVAAVRGLDVPVREEVDAGHRDFGYTLHAEIGGVQIQIVAKLADAAEKTVHGVRTVEDVTYRTPLGQDITGGAS